MTKEEKELLFKDLCARLPYGVIVHLVYDENTIVDREMGLGSLHDIMFDNAEGKPYLRPMESMTEEEKNEISRLLDASVEIDSDGDVTYLVCCVCIPCSDYQIYTDYLIAHHFDYRGLIPMGLALPAKEGMYQQLKGQEE